MGDIFAAIVLVVIVLVFGTAYFLIARKLKTKRRLSNLVTMLTIFGSLLGILITALDSETQTYHPVAGRLSLAFFIVQAIGCVLYFRYKAAGVALLVLTFLFQLPILHGIHYDYLNQTLFSVRIDLGAIKVFDVEPGSYIHYVNMSDYAMQEEFSWGINLVPVFMAGFYLRRLWLDRRTEPLKNTA